MRRSIDFYQNSIFEVSVHIFSFCIWQHLSQTDCISFDNKFILEIIPLTITSIGCVPILQQHLLLVHWITASLFSHGLGSLESICFAPFTHASPNLPKALSISSPWIHLYTSLELWYFCSEVPVSPFYISVILDWYRPIPPEFSLFETFEHTSSDVSISIYLHHSVSCKFGFHRVSGQNGPWTKRPQPKWPLPKRPLSKTASNGNGL